MGEPRWVKRFAQANRPGAYLRVLTPGSVSAGDRVEVVHRPGHGIRIGDVNVGATPDSMRALLEAAERLDLNLHPSLRSKARRAAARASTRADSA